ncbi:unnamed protein product [Meganyctiphanes norvegica]|uniref:heparosan-N-sulfate-glucuronate 5-epimerase n=2 Tax=Meganyctiphanes norvegica TaxID=48144 RepID=A0AAV2R851_MEGNR
MRVTVRGALLGGSMGFLMTILLLWTQCRSLPPVPAPHNQLGPQDSLLHQQELHKQPHRLPLQTNHNQALGSVALLGTGDDNYLEEEAPPDQRQHPQHREHPPQDDEVDDDVGSIREIPCIINQETTISCRRDDQDVYIPWTFIHNYFEVYGRVDVKTDGSEVFEWSHSYSRVYEPTGHYDPTGTFLNFELYNVEARDRVKCVSATEGVPISTQWQSSGYTYPIQIAQFGLSHYCKHLTKESPKKFILEDGETHKGQWKREGRITSFYRGQKKASFGQILQFKAPESLSKGSISLSLSNSSLPDALVMSMDVNLQGNASITVTVEYKDKRPELFHVHYVRTNKLVETKGKHIYYGLGHSDGWRKITRNLLIDLQKGAAANGALPKKYKKATRSKIRLVDLFLNGEGSIDNVTVASAEHINHFYDAANWLITHQDDLGGWSIPVPRKVISGLLELDSGWYSSMAQGQAMSLLVRAAHHSGDRSYLQAAVRATHLFTLNNTQGGVRTYFPGNIVWYEEYPTTPSLFVLNGFIYSLLGLYDLKESVSAPSNIAEDLYEAGMNSLKKLLPLFDTGWGSLYDLRHFTTHVAPNLARWDYHTTHITQLLLLASIDDDPVLASTAQRWKEYMVGHRASHN